MFYVFVWLFVVYVARYAFSVTGCCEFVRQERERQGQRQSLPSLYVFCACVCVYAGGCVASLVIEAWVGIWGVRFS